MFSRADRRPFARKDSIMDLPATSQERPDRSLAAIVLLAAISLIGIVALLPSTEEKAAALLADKKYDQAIGLLTVVDQKGELNAYEAFMLAQLYLLSGQSGAAVQLLEKQIQAAPDATWPLQQLAEVHRQDGNLAAEAKALQALYGLEPNAERFNRLEDLYRQLGDRPAEQHLLTDAKTRGFTTEADQQRLRQLQTGTPDAQSSLWPAGAAGTAPHTPHFSANPGVTFTLSVA